MSMGRYLRALHNLALAKHNGQCLKLAPVFKASRGACKVVSTVVTLRVLVDLGFHNPLRL